MICPIHEDIANTNLEYEVCDKCKVDSFEDAKNYYPKEYTRWLRDNIQNISLNIRSAQINCKIMKQKVVYFAVPKNHDIEYYIKIALTKYLNKKKS